MALTKTLPTLDPGGLAATERRAIQAGIVARAANGTPRTGVIPAHSGALVTGKASMAVDIAPFVAALSRVPGLVEFVANDAPTSFAPAGWAAPSANSRIDVLYVQPQFIDAADAGNTPVFGIKQGDASPTPSKPTNLPAGAFELATIEIPSTATTTVSSGVVITQTHRYTAMAGGTVLVRNAAERAAWTPADGAECFQLDTGTKYARTGGVWALSFASYPVTNLTAVAPWQNNTGADTRPQGWRKDDIATVRGGFFGGAAGQTVCNLPDFMWPTRTLVVQYAGVISGTPTTPTDLGFATVFTNGVMQLTIGTHARTQFSWSVT